MLSHLPHEGKALEARAKQAVNSAQVKLTADTNRQIADLRAKGEFEKADNVLEISNKYLTELQNMEKWAKETSPTASGPPLPVRGGLFQCNYNHNLYK